MTDSSKPLNLQKNSLGSLLAIALLTILSACVPKTEYEDQATRLKDAETQVKVLEQNTQECDPDTFIQLKEQTQSLDVLTQELVERNTALSNEVARLRPYEAKFRELELQSAKQSQEVRQGMEAQVERTKRTYEDLIAELEKKVKRLEEQLAAAKKPAPAKKAPAKPANSSNSAPAKKP